MTADRNPWFSFAADSIRLGIEAQDVIGLRLIKAAWGDFDAGEEAVRMVAEKALAAWDAHCLITQSLIAGEGHLAPARALNLYRRRVRANQRRLARAGRAIAEP
ncbi:MAG TPA: hypothetical protein VG166_03785 [Caulobacteraceae bacterium]|jgi:hypothetical protein|nr:hypothetical protein [Caulobacteraceae bacterium]